MSSLDLTGTKAFIDRGRLERIIRSMTALKKIVEIYVCINNSVVSQFNDTLNRFINPSTASPPTTLTGMLETLNTILSPVLTAFSQISQGEIVFDGEGNIQVEFLRKSLILMIKYLFMFNASCCNEIEIVKTRLNAKLKNRNLTKLQDLFVFCDPELKTNVYLVKKSLEDITSNYSCSSHYEVIYVTSNAINKVLGSNVYNQSMSQLEEALNRIKDNITSSIFVNSNRQTLPIDLNGTNEYFDATMKSIINFGDWQEGYLGPNRINLNYGNQSELGNFLRYSNYPLKCNNGRLGGAAAINSIFEDLKEDFDKWFFDKSLYGKNSDDDIEAAANHIYAEIGIFVREFVDSMNRTFTAPRDEPNQRKMSDVASDLEKTTTVTSVFIVVFSIFDFFAYIHKNKGEEAIPPEDLFLTYFLAKTMKKFSLDKTEKEAINQLINPILRNENNAVQDEKFTTQFANFKANHFYRREVGKNIYQVYRPEAENANWQKMEDIGSDILQGITERMNDIRNVSKESSEYSKIRDVIVSDINSFFDMQEKQLDRILEDIGLSMPFYSKVLDKNNFDKDYQHLMEKLSKIDPRYVQMDGSFKTQRKIIEHLPIFKFVTQKIMELKSSTNIYLNEVHENYKKISALEEIEFDNLKLSISSVLPLSSAKGGIYISNFIPANFLDKDFYKTFTSIATKFTNLNSYLNATYVMNSTAPFFHVAVNGIQMSPLDAYVIQSTPIAEYGRSNTFVNRVFEEFNRKMACALELFQMLFFELSSKKKSIVEAKSIISSGATLAKDSRTYKFFSPQTLPTTANASTLSSALQSRKIIETTLNKSSDVTKINDWFYGISNFLVNKVVNPYVNLFFNMFDFTVFLLLSDQFLSLSNSTSQTGAESIYADILVNPTSPSAYIYTKLKEMKITYCDCIFYIRMLSMLTIFSPGLTADSDFSSTDTMILKIVNAEKLFDCYASLLTMLSYLDQSKLCTEIKLINPNKIEVVYSNIGTNNENISCKTEINKEWFKEVASNTYPPLINFVDVISDSSAKKFKVTPAEDAYRGAYDWQDLSQRLVLLNALSTNTYPLVSMTKIQISTANALCIKNLNYAFKKIKIIIEKP